MTNKIKYSSKTDKAWETLYSRLQNDGLVPVAPCLPSGKLSGTFRLWINAAAILFLIGISTFFILRKEPTFPEEKILTLINEKGAPALVKTLEDGSVIYLGENASLSYPEHFSQDKREVELQGNALFDVSGNKTRPFLITTEQMEIEVLGTSFQVKSFNQEKFEVSVKEGKVKVTNKENMHSVFVEAGETVIYNLQTGFELFSMDNEDDFNQYTNLFYFKDEKLLHAIQVLNRKSNDKIIQLDRSVENRSLTVTFSKNNSIQEMAELIRVALDINLEEKNNTFILSD